MENGLFKKSGGTNMFDSDIEDFGKAAEYQDDKEIIETAGDKISIFDLLDKGIFANMNYRRKAAGLGMLSFFLIFYAVSLFMYFVKNSTGIYTVKMSLNPVRVFMEGFSFSELSGIFIPAVSLVLSVFIAYRYVENATCIDRRKIKRSRNDTYGSADWLNHDKKAMRRIFDIRPLKEPVGTPLGRIGDMALCMPKDPSFDQFSNKNMIIIGGSGSGKSFSGINPMVASRIMYGESYVVTDTKGALYNDTAKLAEKFGYTVKVFNLKNPVASDAWDIMREIAEADMQSVHELVDIYVDIIIENTIGDKKSGDSYWADNEKVLLRALLLYVGKSERYHGKRTFDAVTKMLSEKISDIDRAINMNPDEGRPLDAAADAYRNIGNMEDIRIKDQFRSGLSTRLKVFLNPNISAMMTNDDIHFEDMTKGKYAIYLVTHDSNGAYDFITALFVTCLYNRLNTIAESPGFSGRLRRDVYLILDEFANLSYIPDFDRKISTSRSKHINIIFAVQSIQQLEEKYKGKEDTIYGQCATTLFYGASDARTMKFISEKTGTMTVEAKSRMVEQPIYNRAYIPTEEKVQTADQKRFLMNPDEIGAFSKDEKQCLIFISQKGVVKARTYTQLDHPLWKYCEKTDNGMHIPKWVKEKYPNYRPPEKIAPEVAETDDNPSYSPYEAAFNPYRKGEKYLFGKYCEPYENEEESKDGFYENEEENAVNENSNEGRKEERKRRVVAEEEDPLNDKGSKDDEHHEFSHEKKREVPPLRRILEEASEDESCRKN